MSIQLKTWVITILHLYNIYFLVRWTQWGITVHFRFAGLVIRDVPEEFAFCQATRNFDFRLFREVSIFVFCLVITITGAFFTPAARLPLILDLFSHSYVIVTSWEIDWGMCSYRISTSNLLRFLVNLHSCWSFSWMFRYCVLVPVLVLYRLFSFFLDYLWNWLVSTSRMESHLPRVPLCFPPHYWFHAHSPR